MVCHHFIHFIDFVISLIYWFICELHCPLNSIETTTAKPKWTTASPDTTEGTSGPTTTSDGSNLLCNTDLWSTIKGEWTIDDDECTFENTDSRCGNIVWLGSDDGLTPDEDYDCDTFELSITLEIASGYDAGAIFRTGECSTSNSEGQTYYLGLSPDDDEVVFSTMDDGWTEDYSASVSLSFETEYTLTISGSGDSYSVYVDGTALLEDIELTDFSSGSIGLRTYKAPTTFSSVSFTCGTDVSGNPTQYPTTAEPSGTPTAGPTTYYEGLFVASEETMTFEEAEEYCQALGMHLASIHSDAENDAASDVCCSCWIGLHCMNGDQYDFEWTDGTSWNYTNWNSGEPNNWWNTNEDCVHMYSSGKWNDNQCSADKKALCRKDEGTYLCDLLFGVFI